MICTNQCNRQATTPEGLCDWCSESKARFAELLSKQQQFRNEIRRGQRKPIKTTHFKVQCDRLRGQDAALPPGDRE